MSLYYTDHARDRMKERNISEQEVEECLEKYQTSYPDDNDDDCFNYVYESPGGRRIRVVTKDKGKHRVVISAMD